MRLLRQDGLLSASGRPAVVSAGGLRQWWERGRLHRPDGPAVETPAGTRLYYWKGVRVPAHVILRPRDASVAEILREANVEVRRAWTESYGLEELLAALVDAGDAVIVHETANPPRRLWRVDAITDVDNQSPVYVEVSCPSTDRRYFLRVRPDITTCEEAVASTFEGVTAKDYAQALES